MAEALAMDFMDLGANMSARKVDQNGYITVERNPISRVGVFRYSGKQIPGADPNKIYNVYRPAEELGSQATLDSFKLLPIVDEHIMLGDKYDINDSAPRHGATGENVELVGRDVLAPIRIFSNALKRLLSSGKRGLSLGYVCRYEKSSGVFDGMPYDYIQRQVRGNHLATVGEGRCGTVVLDESETWAFDEFDLALDTGEIKMADENKEAGEGSNAETEKEMSLVDLSKAVKSLLPLIATVNQLAEAVAGAKANKDAATEIATDEDEDDKDKGEKGEKAEAKDQAIALDAALKPLREKITSLEKGGFKAFAKEVAARDTLVQQLTPLVGTFDHAELTVDEVAAYGCEKLGVKSPKGQERTALAGYLTAASKMTGVSFALDSVDGKAKGKSSEVDAYLTPKTA